MESIVWSLHVPLGNIVCYAGCLLLLLLLLLPLRYSNKDRVSGLTSQSLSA
jgi:hypothetical protein